MGPSGPATWDLRGEAAGGRAYAERLQHPEGVHAAPGAAPPRRHADLREDADGQDYHPGCGGQRHDRQREGQDPGQGGHPSGPAAPDLRGEAAGGWTHPQRLQHPEGVHAAPGAAPPWRQVVPLGMKKAWSGKLDLPSTCEARARLLLLFVLICCVLAVVTAAGWPRYHLAHTVSVGLSLV